MKASLRYTYEGEVFRVVVHDDVVAVPGDAWSGDGYGMAISMEWLLHEGVLNQIRPKSRRTLVAELIRRALADAHQYSVPVGCTHFVLQQCTRESTSVFS